MSRCATAAKKLPPATLPPTTTPETSAIQPGTQPSIHLACAWPEQIRGEIDADTRRVCGDNKGLDPTPIHLRFHSPHVPNLTLVDLPGITKNAVGDQPTDIGEQIATMVHSYAARPNTIMLAVTAANTDLANSDAIQVAKRADPDGVRTLGVLTKLDLMDEGTDASEILSGASRDMPHLRLGYVGVVNRSQADINVSRSLGEARQKELEFFQRRALASLDPTTTASEWQRPCSSRAASCLIM